MADLKYPTGSDAFITTLVTMAVSKIKHETFDEYLLRWLFVFPLCMISVMAYRTLRHHWRARKHD